MIKNKDQQIEHLLNWGVEQVIDKNHLKNALKSEKKLRIKYGVDPTSPDIHLGHLACLKKLEEFQKLGHQVIFLIGDYTTKIGDPSGVSRTRPMLTDSEIQKNVKTYLDQVKFAIDTSKTEIRKNSEWLGKLTYGDIVNLASKFTVARILERDDFQKRYENKTPIGLHELFYPVMQAYDSVMLEADVEIGGQDQTFNFLSGRHLQEAIGQKPQDILTLPLLIGLDGKDKMSKSLNNYIGITESPDIQFGKVMSLKDNLIIDYFKLCTEVNQEKIKDYEKQLKTQETNPKDLKEELAWQIVALCHSKKNADQAKAEFRRVFKDKDRPTKSPYFKPSKPKLTALELLNEAKILKSSSEAQRLIDQKAVKLMHGSKEKTLTDWKEVVELKNGDILKIGKKTFLEIRF